MAGSKYSDEVDAVENLRRQYPREGQRTLAKRIKSRNFTDPNANSLAAKLISRTEAGVYGIIRRYDKRISGVTSNALASVGV